MAEKTPVEQLTYKQASQELELIIRSLESGDMELEESLESYTRGVELLKSLRTRLYVSCSTGVFSAISVSFPKGLSL